MRWPRIWNGIGSAQVLMIWESSRRVGEWVRLLELCEQRSVSIFVTTHGRVPYDYRRVFDSQTQPFLAQERSHNGRRTDPPGRKRTQPFQVEEALEPGSDRSARRRPCRPFSRLYLPHGQRPRAIPPDLADAARMSRRDLTALDTAELRYALTFLDEATTDPTRRARIDAIITTLPTVGAPS